MTEDQEFELLEQRMRREKELKIAFLAQLNAELFVQENQSHLCIMTIRKAFELGFLAGYTQAHHQERNRAASIAANFPFSPIIGQAIAELIRKEN